MVKYQTSGLQSSGDLYGQYSEKTHLLRAAGGGGSLVTTHITQRNEPTIELYPRMVRVYSPKGKQERIAGGVRGPINSFTFESKRRLSIAAENAHPELVATFCMTYHEALPDGRTLKKHLNTFLTAFRRKYHGASYLWIVEFQNRGTPHFHFYHSLRHDLPGLGEWLGKTWNRIAEPTSKAHLAFHVHPENCRPWKMETGGYLCKYLNKASQKAVPEGFQGIGRFWGTSRAIVPMPIPISKKDLETYDHEWTDQQTGEIVEIKAWDYIIRTLRRHQKASWRGKRKSKYPVSTFRKGHRLYMQIESYLEKQMGESAPF